MSCIIIDCIPFCSFICPRVPAISHVSFFLAFNFVSFYNEKILIFNKSSEQAIVLLLLLLSFLQDLAALKRGLSEEKKSLADIASVEFRNVTSFSVY